MTGRLQHPACGAASDATALPAGVALRVARASDVDRLARFLAGLSLQSAYRRFFTVLSRPSRAFALRLLELDHDRREAIVAVAGDEIVGFADSSRSDDEPDLVEIGVVVADAWQRRGLGPRLARSVLDLAMRRGATIMRAHSLAENEVVTRMLRRSWPAARGRREGTVLVWEVPLRTEVAGAPAGAMIRNGWRDRCGAG